MECAERGLIDAPWLRFGNGAALLRALDEIGRNEAGLGALLAQGSRRAAGVVGQGSIDFARIFAQSDLAGIKHYFVEHDNPLDPIADVRRCYDYLRQLTF